MSGIFDFEDDNIPDELKCPICLGVPEGKVFQCREGHTLCESCYSTQLTCPQCRIPFEDPPIRSRVSEGMLEKIKVDCHHKGNGCGMRVRKGQLQSHLNGCYFNFAKFGQPRKICKVFGFDCTFQVNRGNISLAVDHLRTSHKMETVSSNKVTVELAYFYQIKSNSDEYCWKPLILHKDDIPFFILPKFNPETKTLSWSTFSLLSPEQWEASDVNYQAKVSIEARESGNKLISGSVSPSDFFEDDSEVPSVWNQFNVPVRSLKDMGWRVLLAHVEVTAEGVEAAQSSFPVAEGNAYLFLEGGVSRKVQVAGTSESNPLPSSFPSPDRMLTSPSQPPTNAFQQFNIFQVPRMTNATGASGNWFSPKPLLKASRRGRNRNS